MSHIRLDVRKCLFVMIVMDYWLHFLCQLFTGCYFYNHMGAGAGAGNVQETCIHACTCAEVTGIVLGTSPCSCISMLVCLAIPFVWMKYNGSSVRAKQDS